ncbi:MAG: serine/threonine protein kinase [Labilithrix sp.]|nr:serine/threonine protein kinase [Labilithrix sp.]
MGTSFGSELVGRVLAGRYEIRRALGQGGMGAVYEARETSTGRRVAIKVLFESDARSLERFRQEAIALTKLDHPNVVQTHGFHDEPGGPAFIVMEHVEGSSLKSHLVARGPLGQAEAVAIASAMLGALEVAHRAGIVHRDIKPANVMLARGADGTETVKLVDFGIAKLAEGGLRTTTGVFLGTPGYLAPEQVSGGVVDGRTDVWAVGVTLFEMLAGTRPWRSRVPAEVIAESLLEAPLPLRGFAPDVSPELEAIVARALDRSPDARFAGAGAMRAALIAVAPTVSRSAPGLAEAPAPPASTHERRVFAVATLASLAVGGAGLAGVLVHMSASRPTGDPADLAAADGAALELGALLADADAPPGTRRAAELGGAASGEAAADAGGGGAGADGDAVGAGDGADGGGVGVAGDGADGAGGASAAGGGAAGAGRAGGARGAVRSVCAPHLGARPRELWCARDHSTRCACISEVSTASLCPVPFTRPPARISFCAPGPSSYPRNETLACRGFVDAVDGGVESGRLYCVVCTIQDAIKDAVRAVPGTRCRGIDYAGVWHDGVYVAAE